MSSHWIKNRDQKNQEKPIKWPFGVGTKPALSNTHCGTIEYCYHYMHIF